MPQVELTRSYVLYQAQSKLLTLADEVTSSGRLTKPENRRKIELATRIGLYIRALEYYEYLDKPTIDKLVYRLADLCDANALPYVPVTGNISAPSLVIGGTTNVTNVTYSDWTSYENNDVDTGTETADEFTVTSARAAVWHYVIWSGSNQRSGTVRAGWLADGSSVSYSENCETDIGSTQGVVSFAVDYSSPNIRLRITTTADNWVVQGKRLLING